MPPTVPSPATGPRSTPGHLPPGYPATMRFPGHLRRPGPRPGRQADLPLSLLRPTGTLAWAELNFPEPPRPSSCVPGRSRSPEEPGRGRGGDGAGTRLPPARRALGAQSLGRGGSAVKADLPRPEVAPLRGLPRPKFSAPRGLRPHHAAGQVSRGRSGGTAVRGGVARPARPQLGSDAGPAGLAWRRRAGSAGSRSGRRRLRGCQRGVDGSGRRGPASTGGRAAVRGRSWGRGPCQGRGTANAETREGRRAHPARLGTGAAPSTPWHR